MQAGVPECDRFCPARSCVVGARVLFRWCETRGLGAFCGCVLGAALTVVRDGELIVRLRVGGVGGDGFLVARDGVSDLSLEQQLITRIHGEIRFLPADGAAGEFGGLAA